MHGINTTKRINEEREKRELEERERCNCPCCAKGNVSELREETDEG